MWFDRYILLFGCLLQSQAVLSTWSCTQNSDCAEAVGAICNEGICGCPSGQQLILGASLCADAPPYLASPCFEDHQCTRLVTNFECRGSGNGQEGICLCREGFHYQNGRCWRSIEYGETCVRDEDCMGVVRNPFSMSCDPVTNTCRCADGYYRRQRGDCRIIATAVNQSCVLDEDCQFPNGRCNINTFRCFDSTQETLQITLEHLPAPSQELSHKLAEEDDGELDEYDIPTNHSTPCSATNSCPDPYICSNFGSCICPVGYYWSGRGDLCYAELGSPSSPEQCVGFLAEVRNGICTCPVNFFFEDDMRNCIKVARTLNDFCLRDVACHTFGTAVRCTDPTPPWGLRNCECLPGLTVWEQDRNMCRLFAGIGDACETNSDCLAGNLEIECVTSGAGEGVCTCPANTVVEDGLCLTMGLELGDACQVSRECTGTANTVCASGRCSCGDKYLEMGGICAPVIGGTCSADADCFTANSICASSGNNTQTCQCAGGYVTAGNNCFPVLADLNSVCNATEQCVSLMGEMSICEDNTCSCIAGYHLRDGNCWPSVGLFGGCSRTSECFLPGISERVVCRNSLCQCAFEYPYSERLHTCSSATSATMGSLFTLLLALNYLLSL